MQTYEAFIKTARRYANATEESWLRLMLLLVKTEEDRDLWLANPHEIRSWPDLLQKEGLCTAKHYRDFRNAKGEFRPNTLKRLGAYAAICLARIPEAQRKATIARTFRWIRKHKVTPTYQRITEFVSAETRAMRPKAQNYRAETKRLHILCDQQKGTIVELEKMVVKQSKYIRRLKLELKKHDIAIPPPLQS